VRNYNISPVIAVVLCVPARSVTGNCGITVFQKVLEHGTDYLLDLHHLAAIIVVSAWCQL